MRVLDRHVPPDGSGRVSVLCNSEDDPLVRRIRARHPGLRIVPVKSSMSGSERHVRLTATGPFVVIVDGSTTGRGRQGRFRESFFHLRKGGVIIVRGAGGALDAENPSRLGLLLRRARGGGSVLDVAQGRQVPSRQLYDEALGRALDGVHDDGGHLVVRNRADRVLAKLREDELNAYLAQRPESPHRVVEVIRSEPFTSRCVIRENAPPRGKQPPSFIEPPDISLREYHDVVVTPGQVVSDDRVILPDSYRHNQARRLTNRFTEEVAPRFARLKHPGADLEERSGTYFHLDNEVRGHFGHLLTEQLSRLWAWPQAKGQFPDLKLLLGTNRRTEVQPYEYKVYEAAGVAPEDVVMLDEPARVERLLSATPMFSNPAYVHPRIAETWRRVGDNLAATATGGVRPSRFFCSRRIRKRSCTNTSEVEALFEAQGFEIIFPEDLTLGDQIETFRKADVIAGFAGSGLFNMCFVDQPKRVIMLSSRTYSARNEYLFASVLGHEIDLITSEARDPVFQSPFTFDHDKEGHDLAGVFATLSEG
jgi:capsular polysaccharide biosynthesis protein